MTWTWTGLGGDNLFGNALNWNPQSVPSTNGDGTINVPAGSSIVLSANETVQVVNITGTGTAAFTGAYTVTMNTLNLADGQTYSLGSTTIFDVRQQPVFSGTGTATISGGTIDVAAAVTLAAGQNLVIAGGAFMHIQSSITGAGTLTLNGGTLQELNNVPTVTINFGSAGGSTLDVSSWMTGLTITNFSYGDVINNGGGSLKLVANGVGNPYLLETTGGKKIGTVTLASGTPGAGGAAVGSAPVLLDNSGGNNTYPCFYPGTMLATADGEIAVEHVTVGMMLKTVCGALKPVRWVGWSDVSAVFGDPLKVLPVRIRAGALAEGVPARDLLVSPDHALFMGGVLVQAGALVNGVSIIREENVPESFRYYHVELETHELLLAEGAPAESFVDNIDRMNFQNWDVRTAPDAMVPEMDLPRVKAKRQLPAAVRAVLDGRMALFAGRNAA